MIVCRQSRCHVSDVAAGQHDASCAASTVAHLPHRRWPQHTTSSLPFEVLVETLYHLRVLMCALVFRMFIVAGLSPHRDAACQRCATVMHTYVLALSH